MAEYTSMLPAAPTPILVFKGDGYEYWSIRMKTILRSRDLWDLVVTGFDETEQDLNKLKVAQKRDAYAMAVIQQAVHDQLFSRVAAASTAKETWEILKMEFEGDSQVKFVKLQGLRRDFENLSMNEGELIGEYFGRVMAIVSQKRAYGKVITDQSIVEKILRSLTPKFDYVVPSIEVSYDLSKLTPVKLMGSLQSQEERINSRTPKKVEKSEEQALQVVQPHNNSGGTRGRGRDYWYLDEPQANVAAENEAQEEGHDEQRLFMAMTDHAGDQYLLLAKDQSSGAREMFTQVDESYKLSVRLGDKKELAIEGKDDVYFAPKLEYILLSVGQLMKKGYSLLFNDGKYVSKAVYGNQSNNKMDETTRIWHLRYGHCHCHGLKLLHDKSMVHGMPNIRPIDTCEGCVMGKQSRDSFPSKSWRASKKLELIHTDVCGPMQVSSLGGNK
ncbi:uncharacterized protein LOC143593534 [Bidens hawaiensis]|uniref:uncharacterized protein LOC143593534 n=1 Tax=Bidens hawaiensis TaxID=980011 RepID=UPI00404A8070